MKELSIGQKARAYDEALKVIKECVPDKNGFITIYPQEIFPELKESEEDEKIRKSIINLVIKSAQNGGMALHKWESQQMIAWLEKQGKKIAEMRETKPKDISEFLGRLTTVEQEFLWEHIAKIRELDKQEQKDILEDTILDSNEDGLIAETIRYKNEQKLVDKVEPKFHKGEWIVFNGLTLCVKEVVKGFYITTSIDGITNGYDWDIDNAARLWTIRDAKDGDVLCTYECGEPKIVFVLKGTPKIYYALSYHCYYNIMYSHFESDSEKGCLAPNDEDVKPATKEQRDTLLKAMADARYTFDFDKKELKNIEQKSAEWHREDEQNLNACLGFIRDEFLRRWLIDVIHSKYDKTTWSEEDEYHKRQILRILKDNGCSQTLQEKTEKWIEEKLKSIRPQSHWKPSDEQMENLSRAFNSGTFRTSLLMSLYQDLKKLMEE